MSRVVLVVDDDPGVLETLADMLSDLGCEVVTAPGPREALEKLSADARIELLFTDIEMPIMDGGAEHPPRPQSDRHVGPRPGSTRLAPGAQAVRRGSRRPSDGEDHRALLTNAV